MGIVLISHIGTRVLMPDFSIAFLQNEGVRAITTTEHFTDLVGSIHLNVCGRGRGSITATIDLIDAGSTTTVDNDLSPLSRILVVGRYRCFCSRNSTGSHWCIRGQVSTAINCLHIISAGSSMISNRIFIVDGVMFRISILRSEHMYSYSTLRRTIQIITTEYTCDNSSLFSVFNTAATINSL